ncbi:hypothetical protein P7K49_035721 [Saguinus oedipus]|uniref:Fibronectin type-III domain-containing protein n=1 Tax=Saguinus oedipus TaxID=9490 RepID=A0ABQ9TNE4_SAGOE|nr:hypothetical protein P7K49_035721 [Saguinus oedipus]
MTEKNTSEDPACSPEETTSESAKVPTAEPPGEVAASESTGEEQVPKPQAPAPQTPAAPAATKPVPPSEDVPSAPLLLTLEDVSSSSVTVSWEPPERLGRLGLQGYVLELCREGALEWVPVNARPMMVTQQTVRNLALGDKFLLRVSAVSSAGAGPPAVLDQPIHIRENIGKARPGLLLPSPSQTPYLMEKLRSAGRGNQAVISPIPRSHAQATAYHRLALGKLQVPQQQGASGGLRSHFPEWSSSSALRKGPTDAQKQNIKFPGSPAQC